MSQDIDLKAAVAAMAGGSSSASSSTAPSSSFDDITPFPSPMLTPQSMAGLSRESLCLRAPLDHSILLRFLPFLSRLRLLPRSSQPNYPPPPASILSVTLTQPVSSDGELEHEFDELREVTDEDRAAALELKAKANKAYGAKDFAHSIELYTQAIKLNPHDSTFWNNRAMSKAKMEEHGAAIADATKAIEIKPDYAKAYYRRGVSSLAVVRPKDAVPDFKKALEIEPANRVVREQLNATIKLIRRIEFEKVRQRDEMR